MGIRIYPLPNKKKKEKRKKERKKKIIEIKHQQEKQKIRNEVKKTENIRKKYKTKTKLLE